MLDAIKGRRERDDEGFTLIELMVVLLIIAILMAIAIPTFLGARNTANARAAQSNLTNALTAEQTYWTNNQSFSGNLTNTEPSLTWETAALTSTQNGNQVYAVPGDNNQAVVITALGKDGQCWTIAQINDPNPPTSVGPDGTYYQRAATSSGGCVSPAVPTAAATSGSATNGTAGSWYTSF
jgi:type IV pilus assembly protein PilA